MTRERRPVLITGGGRGIGREIARSLSAAGHPVAITARQPDAAEATAAEIVAAGGSAFATAMDVRDSASIRDAVAAAATALGSRGGLVNNAGLFHQAPRADQRRGHRRDPGDRPGRPDQGRARCCPHFAGRGRGTS